MEGQGRAHSNRELWRAAEPGVRAVRGELWKVPLLQCREGESSIQEAKKAAVGLSGVGASEVAEGAQGNRTWG